MVNELEQDVNYDALLSEEAHLLPENQIEPIEEFLAGFGRGESTLGLDPKKPKVLEVNQVWSGTILDTQHFKPGQQHITIGSSVGWRWNLLGRDIGWIASPMDKILPWMPPMWSEVTSEWRNHFYTPDESLPYHKRESDLGEGYELFVSTGTDFLARVSKKWTGHIEVDGKRHTFEQGLKAGLCQEDDITFRVPMTDNIRLFINIEGIEYYAHMVASCKKLIAKKSIDYPFLAIFSFVAFIGLMFGVVMYITPRPPENELSELPDRFVELMLEKPEQKKKDNKRPEANPDAGEGAKAKKEEGKVGKKDAKMKKAKGNKVEIKKQELDRQIAENAGVLGALRDGAELDGVFGSSLNSDITGGIGGLIGAKGVQIGAGGLGSRGSGLGGGGTAEGIGGLGTKGKGSGRSGYGRGGGNFGAKGDGAIGAIGGDPIILGALDRSLIDEVIKRHMNQIRYCYQRELPKNPSLGGKIVIKFVIAKDGTVSKSNVKSSTMGSPAVESCVKGRFMRMQFPEPKGGGIVIVSYPFIFAPA